jgi:hypothetical protein
VAEDVRKIKESGELKGDLSNLPESYRAPAAKAEGQFKNQVEAAGRRVARMLLLLEDELERLDKVGAMRNQVSRRWQANYDFMRARLKLQIAYAYEYSSMLGMLRKEMPPRDPAVHGGWRLASRDQLTGDALGRKMNRDARKLLDELIQKYPGTPWEVLARREKATALGLEWKPEK